MSNLEALFRQTFDDHVFTRDERRAMAKILQEEDLSEKDLGILRSKVFNIAMDELDDTDADQVLEWLRQAVKLLLPDGAPAFRYEVYFSPEDNCPEAIIRCFQEARRSADVCVFTISDNRISKAMEAAQRRGVDVRIISDNDKTFDRGSDIMIMASRGLSVKLDDTSNHMHHKFAIFDNELLLSGSYNWTVSAANHNEENILITNQPEIVAPFRKEFNRLWKRLKQVEA